MNGRFLAWKCVSASNPGKMSRCPSICGKAYGAAEAGTGLREGWWLRFRTCPLWPQIWPYVRRSDTTHRLRPWYSRNEPCWGSSGTSNGIGGINQPPDFLRKLGIVPIMDSVAKTAYEFMPVYRSLTIRYILASMIMMLLWNRTILSELKSTSVKSYLLLGLCMASTFIFSNVVLHHTAATNVAFLLRCRSCSPLCSAIASTKNMLGRKSL